MKGLNIQHPYLSVIRVVKNKKVLSGNKIDFDLSNFAAGVYQLQITDGGHMIILSVVKQ